MKIDDVLTQCKNANVKRYLKDTLNQLEEMGIPIKLDAGLCMIGKNAMGFFSEAEGIRCYIGDGTYGWTPIIEHEKQHAIDYLNQHKCWRDYEALGIGIDQIIKKGKPIKNKIKTGRILINLERRAEMAAIRAIKKYNLPINLNNYIQEANLTLYKYIFTISNGYWPRLPNKVQDKIVAQMPKKLLAAAQFTLTKMPVLLRNQLEELRIK